MQTQGKARLLVVDDEPDVLDFVERVFRREYVVVRAASVDEAVRALGEGAFDVVITDHRMPRGSGYDVLDKARATQPAAVRLLLTGYADDNESLDCADARLPK